jgi:Helicase conserved C-terminal domain/SNF2-related domain
MLQTDDIADDARPAVADPPTHVACRARTWRVLDVHRAAGTTLWRLSRNAEMPRLIASPPDEVSAVAIRRRSMSRRTWLREALAHLRSHVPVWWPAGAPALPIAALPWQFVPAMMILSGHHRRVLLADEVGMGKTVQAGLLLHEVHAREPDAATLVITPATLLSQWASELQTRVCLAAAVLDAGSLRREAASPQAIVDATRAGTCWLMSIDLLRQPDVVALVARTRWTLLVVDEAHVAAPGTARIDAVARVAAASVRVLLLTATPTAAGAAAADALRGIGARPGERPMPVLRRQASLLARPGRRSRVLQASLDAAHAALCVRLDDFVERARCESAARGLLPALVLRRRAASCPAALRRSLERRLEVLGLHPSPAIASDPGLFPVELCVDQDAHDDELMRIVAWADAAAEREELATLLRLVRLVPASGHKLECVARLLRRCREPVVVFTSFLDTLRALRSLLPAAGVVVVHGEQPDALRAYAIESFTSGDARVLLATDTAAEGLNLHARCRLVVHTEVPWSLRVLEQRIGRLDRYGQSRRVHSIVISSETSEDRSALVRLQARAASDGHWMAGVVASRCRRAAVAACMLAGDPTSRQVIRRTTAKGPGGDESVGVCRLRPRRWRRLSSRLGLGIHAKALWAATVRVAGGPELSASRVPVLLTGDPAALPASAAAACRDQLRGPIERARGLARRLARWEDAAALAIEFERSVQNASPDLFADAWNGSEVRPAARREPEPWVALEGTAVISIRPGPR